MGERLGREIARGRLSGDEAGYVCPLKRRARRTDVATLCGNWTGAHRKNNDNCVDAIDISAKDIPPCGCASPGIASAATCYCAVDDLLRIIRRRYSLAAMNVIHAHGRARYHDIASALSQASSSTLAETLRALESARLVTRRDLSEHGPCTEYTLTGSGEKLLRRLRSLLDEVQI